MSSILKNLFYILLIVFLSACRKKELKKVNQDRQADSIYTSFEHIFYEVDSLLKIDASKFWNIDLSGSILFVNPETREFVANQNNKDQNFRKQGKVFVDTLPNNLNIANTAIDWEGKRWTIVMTPLPNNKNVRNNLIIHELFHRVQPSIGFDGLSEISNDHLDTYDGRVLLKLELEALKLAISAKSLDSCHHHIKNALYFRVKRQLEGNIKNAENTLEINEGLAEYTGVMLSGRTPKEMETHFIESIDLFYQNKTFIRSFAYQTIPLYGYLLSKINPNWQHSINKETNLTDYFIHEFAVLPFDDMHYANIAAKNNYNFKNIIEEEKEREAQRLARITAYKKVFVEGKTLELPFRNMNISFDPRNIMPLENYGTVYPTMRVTDDWGILTVKEGALLDTNWSKVTVSEPSKIDSDVVEGSGWILELKEGWKVVNENGLYILKEEH
ncbi:MAG: hypothetical protein HWD85_00085 [Flavobacteriaceae bacterium]|nr:hypothetical protein [Flavobacteriaceae bacterium]